MEKIKRILFFIGSPNSIVCGLRADMLSIHKGIQQYVEVYKNKNPWERMVMRNAIKILAINKLNVTTKLLI